MPSSVSLQMSQTNLHINKYKVKSASLQKFLIIINKIFNEIYIINEIFLFKWNF